MTLHPVPGVSALIRHMVRVSASYQALSASHKKVDPAFRDPVERLLTIIGTNHVFDTPFYDANDHLAAVRNKNALAGYVVERSPAYREHWHIRLQNDPRLQQRLWEQIEAAADGFLQAGYEIYTADGQIDDWAAGVLQKEPETQRRLQSVEEIPGLRLSLLHVEKHLAEKEYEAAAQQILWIHEKSGGRAVHYPPYLDLLCKVYPGVPFGSRLRALMAEELEASGHNEALNHLSIEAINTVAHWITLKGPQKLLKCRLLATAVCAYFRYRNVLKKP